MLAYIRKVVQIKRDEGASAVEYGLLVAAIAALIVIVVFALGNTIQKVFQHTCDSISQKTAPSSGNC
ncbi:MAG: Flp/Fap pilin component [Actinomycetota bacterium]|jgi:pilus assembly protein Flp/PilA|nr:Flp/Fap pilin component [Actinomycetota bacterium]